MCVVLSFPIQDLVSPMINLYCLKWAFFYSKIKRPLVMIRCYQNQLSTLQKKSSTSILDMNPHRQRHLELSAINASCPITFIGLLHIDLRSILSRLNFYKRLDASQWINILFCIKFLWLKRSKQNCTRAFRHLQVVDLL